MKIRVLLTLFLLINVANAGMDTTLGQDSVVAIYHFEIESFDTEYTKDSGPEGFHAYFPDRNALAMFSEDGKHGGCILLSENDTLHAFMERPPRIGEFTISAWVKLEQQKSKTSLYFSIEGTNIGLAPYSQITLSIRSDGNIGGAQIYEPEDIGLVFTTFGSKDQNVADNNWHHIALSSHMGADSLYIDGEIVAIYQEPTPPFSGKFTSFQIGSAAEFPLTGDVLIDDVGIFRTGFSIYEMRGLYNDSRLWFQ